MIAMNPRQYKKLCKKAKEILISGGMSEKHFSKDWENCHGKYILCWGVDYGPDYFGECDWNPAWHVLSTDVTDDTTIYSESGSDFSNCPIKTPDVLRHARQMANRNDFSVGRWL